jgi:hypothetical protein
MTLRGILDFRKPFVGLTGSKFTISAQEQRKCNLTPPRSSVDRATLSIHGLQVDLAISFTLSKLTDRSSSQHLPDFQSSHTRFFTG